MGRDDGSRSCDFRFAKIAAPVVGETPLDLHLAKRGLPATIHLEDHMPCLRMAKKERIPTNLFVEPTQYGWPARVGTEQLALLVTQRQALSEAKRQRAELLANGQLSTVVTSGHESEQRAGGQLPRPHWTRSR